MADAERQCAGAVQSRYGFLFLGRIAEARAALAEFVANCRKRAPGTTWDIFTWLWRKSRR